MTQANRVILNTAAQYVKIICVALITLFSTRIVLKELGSEDFGLYSLVGSVLAFLAFLNTTIVRSTQRFLSFYKGNGNLEKQRIVLFNALILNLFIGITTTMFIMMLEPAVFRYLINIEISMQATAHILYKIMGVSLFLSVITSPYSAIFVSNENIIFSSFLGIFTSVLRLMAAVILMFLEQDKLLYYGVFICIICIFEFAAYNISSRLIYKEACSYFNYRFFDKTLQKRMLSFSFWTMYGSICIMARNQGYAFVINKYLGLVGNAAYGIANQVSGLIQNVVYSLSNAVSPVITKAQGGNDERKASYWALISSKYTIIMFAAVAFPILFNIEYILEIWLGSVPQFTVPFVIYIVIACICDCYVVGFRTGIQAVGELNKYSLWVFTLKLTSIPFSILMLSSGLSPSILFLPYILTEICGSVVTVYYFCYYTHTTFKQVYVYFLSKMFIPLTLNIGILLILNNCIAEGFVRTIMEIALSFIITILLTFHFSMENNEKKIVISLLKKNKIDK